MSEADEAPEQPDLFGAAAQPVYRPDAEKVRRRLASVLSEARAATSMPWSAAIVSLYREIVPRMTTYLPEDEGAQLRLEFEEELERLKAA